MSLPDNPQSRSEQYLNAIATGNNSGLPDFPQSREEQYLDYIAKNGGGGGGSGGGVFSIPITFSNNKLVMTKTFQEVKDAADSGLLVFAYIASEEEYVSFFITHMAAESTCLVYAISDGGNCLFTAESANDYPSMDN